MVDKEKKELLGSGGFPLEVAYVDARSLGSRSPTGQYVFGINRDNVAETLRKFADDIEAAKVLIQDITMKSVATIDEYVLHTLEIRFVIPLPKPEEKAS